MKGLTQMEMEQLRKAMKKAQDKDRYEHTLAVAYTSACLATLNDVDAEKALRAGLLHDCAKCIPTEQKLSLCKQYGIAVSAIEKRNPSLLHAKLGAVLAKEKYGETDVDVLNAIENHTTGRKNMSMLEKIVFIADYIEPNRSKAQNLTLIRKLAFSDIDAALVKILEDTLKYLEGTGTEIDPNTKETLDFYVLGNQQK